MKKYLFLLLLSGSVFNITSAKAQYGHVFIGGGYGGGYYRRPYPQRRPMMVRQRPQQPQLPRFQPSLNISIGYGFPNLDKNQLASFYNEYRGNTISQTGPVTGAVDYQFSRFMSIGIMGTYGKVSAPYYNYNSSGNTPPAFTGSLENWSIMFDLVNYIPVYDNHVTPYLRTAIGVNNWNQNYLDADGNKAAFAEDPSSLAYQVSFGAKFKLSPQSAFFLEAGYGKYIVNGGLSFKF